MLVAISIDHAGKPSRLDDRGAAAGELQEVSLVRAYTDAIDHELRELGHQVVILSDGEYRDRWKRADGYGADVYLACHMNACGGDYGLIVHDYRSLRGERLAEAIASEISDLGWRCRSEPGRPDDDGQPRDEDYTEAWNCIAGVKAVAVCVEPYFVDGPRAREVAQRYQEIGAAIARGIDQYARG